MLESEIERKIGRVVRERGGLWLKWVSPGHAGVPDRILICPGGRVIFVELKRPGGTLRGLQRWFRDELRHMGCDARVTHSYEEVLAIVDEVLPARLPDESH